MATGFWQRWMRQLRDGVRPSSLRKADRRRSKRTIPRLEALEARETPANFTAGNIAVLDLAAASTNTTGSILELSPSANQSSPVQTIGVASTGTNAIRFSDSGTSGFLSDTNDRTLLSFAAYNTPDTTDADLANSPTNDRAVGTLGVSGGFTLQTTYTGTAGNQARSATSLDDSNFYITDKGGLYTNGASTPSLSTNILDARSFGGVVYVSSTNPAGFSASITWGDGHTSSGVIAFAGSNNETNINGQTVNVSLFTVTGTNTYAATGSYPISVTITDPNNNSTTVNPTARVAYAPLAVTAAGTLTTSFGASFTDGVFRGPRSTGSSRRCPGPSCSPYEPSHARAHAP